MQAALDNDFCLPGLFCVDDWQNNNSNENLPG
jgi:hypothetical protein